MPLSHSQFGAPPFRLPRKETIITSPPTATVRASITRRSRAAVAGLVAAAFIALGPSMLTAHDFWIVPDAFSVTSGGRIAARGQTSSLFPTSVSAVTPDRLADARVLTAERDMAIRSASIRGTSLVLAYRPTTTGQHVLAVRLAPRSIRESPASFRHYLDLEGAPEARQHYERTGQLPPVGGDSLTRRYAKYAKSFIEVGKGARAFDRVVGHPLELVPLSDPAALTVGDTLQLRVLLLGEPVPQARLHSGSVSGRAALSDTAFARRAAAMDQSVQADDAGLVSIAITRTGLWNVRTIQIVPAAPGSGANWDVHWATIVLGVTRR